MMARRPAKPRAVPVRESAPDLGRPMEVALRTPRKNDIRDYSRDRIECSGLS